MKPEKTIMDGLRERVQAIEREMKACTDDKELFSLSMERANLEHVIQRINLQEEREYLEVLEKLVDDARRDVCKCLGEYAKAEKSLREIEEKYRTNRGEKP